nr:bacterioferritin [Acidimicrobiia bacterium]
VGETVPEQFRLDLAVEHEAIERFNRGIALAQDTGDNGTSELLTAMLVEEEHHIDYLETQLALINSVGEANYLAQHLHA